MFSQTTLLFYSLLGGAPLTTHNASPRAENELLGESFKVSKSSIFFLAQLKLLLIEITLIDKHLMNVLMFHVVNIIAGSARALIRRNSMPSRAGKFRSSLFREIDYTVTVRVGRARNAWRDVNSRLVVVLATVNYLLIDSASLRRSETEKSHEAEMTSNAGRWQIRFGFLARRYETARCLPMPIPVNMERRKPFAGFEKNPNSLRG